MTRNCARICLYVFLGLMLIVPIAAQAQDKGTVKVGDTIPTTLEFKDQTGKVRSFSDLVGDKGMVLIFIRSVEWCPFCQKQLIEMDNNRQKFLDAGYSVVSLSYDDVDHMKKFVTTSDPKITLLSDPASDSIRAFGILNEANVKGTMSYGIPYPGVYLVGKDKKVQAMFFKDGYENRASVEELLTKIEELNAPDVPPMTIDSMGQDPITPEEQFMDTPDETLPPVISPDDIQDEEETGDAPEALSNEGLESEVEEGEGEPKSLPADALTAPELEQVEPTRDTSPDAMDTM